VRNGCDEVSNRYFDLATEELKKKYDIDIIFDVILGRKDRVLLYGDISDKNRIEMKVISGTLEYIGLPNGQSFMLSELLNHIDLANKYAELSGKGKYLDYVYGELFNFHKEIDITFPVFIEKKRKWLRFNNFPVEKNKNVVTFFVTDVTELLDKEEELYEKTHKDALTNLYNKYSLDFHYGQRYHLPNFHALYLDLDNFKIMNDAYGHASGNEFLRKFSIILKTHETEKNKFYRIGGDEFVGLLFESEEKIRDITKNILEETRKIQIPNCDKNVTVSIGIIQATKREDVIRKADDVLYKVKANGKDNYLYEIEV